MKKKTEENQYLYYDLSAEERDSALRFLLNSILKIKADNTSLVRKDAMDDDVNVYLAHLLFAIALPEYHEMADPYLSMRSTDIMDWVKNTEDRTVRYFIYKVNADHVLIHTTIFNDLTGGRRKGIFGSTDDYYRELAKVYYAEAAKYHQQINRKKTGIGRVLEKISADFVYYQRIIELLREDYLSFVQSSREKHFNEFLTQVSTYERENYYEQKMDDFLKAFYEWNQAQNEAMRAKVEQLASDLKRMNPQFRFRFPPKDIAS